MVIDFHVHAFDERIAEKAISKLEATADSKAFNRGTIKETIDCFDKWGVDKGVLLTIATKPSQQKTINDWALNQASDRIIPFGSVHPDAEDVFEELERIKLMGLKGIKFHPDYQEFFIDDEKMLPIYKKSAELGLIVVFHAGFDPLSPDKIHAMPEASASVFKAVPNMTMVLAHLGGMNHFDDVEKYLVGLKGNLYFDTAFINNNIDKLQLERIIKNHGADRILFASDSPWHEASGEISLVKSLGISDEDKELILHKNAERLLGL